MPINPTYPGVYVEEVSSGVRTITGVSTSVTAFLGSARRGPINRAVRVFSYADFERRFGGLHLNSYMSFAVRQFFLNGGTEAWIIRLAMNPAPATTTLKNDALADVLELKARDEGKAGNFIEVRVDYATANPASTFGLTLTYNPPDLPSDATSERWDNLSMNSADARYVVDALAGSRLVEGKRVAALGALGSGTSTGGDLVNVNTLLDDDHKQFQVSINGLPAVLVQLVPVTDNPDLATLCTKIRDAIKAQANGEPALNNVTCAPDGNKIKITSGVGGEFSSVRVLPGPSRDAASRLKLGTANSGVEVDAVAVIRPRLMPDPGTLTAGKITTNVDLPDATHHTFKISLDNGPLTPVYLGTASAKKGTIKLTVDELAKLITQQVQLARPTNPAYTGFKAINNGNEQLLLSSGTRGKGSAVAISPGDAESIAADLHLLPPDAVALNGKELTLTGGDEQEYTENDEPTVFVGNRTNRKGLYALEEVDIFNILCLPGVTNPDVLAAAEAYARERRAFLVIDAPKKTITDPNEMIKSIGGPDLPKSNYAAVFYPWLKISNPLKNGKLEDFPPSGAIAGLFARTDSTRGVWKAPAGTEATLVGVQGMSYPLSEPEMGSLNPLGVNNLRVFPLFGPLSWGARTLRGANEMADEYKYIPIRRTALFIEETLYRNLKWVVFEPNDEPLWSQIRLNVGAFMHSLFRQGAFQGKSPSEAYFVKCDHETTTQDDINRGVVNILVGFAPLKPVEFVIIKVQQIAGQFEAA